MSFNSDLKSELVGIIPKSIHCRSAQLGGYISVSGRMETHEGLPVLAIRVETDELEELILRLVRMTTHISDSSIIRMNEIRHHRKVLVTGQDNIDEVFSRLKLRTDANRLSPNNLLTERGCCKRSYIKGAFLAGGSISSPEKSYQMEISTVSQGEADKLIDMLGKLGLVARSVLRRDRYIVYIKDGDTIADFIGLIGATNCLMDFENIRILKDIRNNVNREVNCDTANMAKIAKSSSKQIEDINYILSVSSYDNMPDGLRDIAILRIEYPYLSLKELGEICSPPLGKSGVSHRLRKISEYADSLRKNNL